MTDKAALKQPRNGSQNHTFYLNGLECAHCAAKIETTLKNRPDLKEVEFSFATKRLDLKTNENAPETRELLQTLIDDIEEGVVVTDSDETDTVAAIPKRPTFADFLKSHWALILGSGLFLASRILFSRAFTPPLWADAAVLGIAYLLIGGDVVLRALKNLMKGRLFDENFLMSLATFGAFALGETTEALAVMFFYKIGEAFQDKAVAESRRNIKSLLSIQAETAGKIVDGRVVTVSPKDLIQGDEILIRAGEKIPADGIILEGRATLDTSALTGESLPRTAEPGDKVLSGSISTGEVIRVRVSTEYKNSTAARILDMVENAASKKAKTEQFITKFARYYTPAVVTAAVFLALLPPVITGTAFGPWIQRALIFLVISCPCALVLSVPLGFFGGIGSASRKGILIKGGNHLEALNSIDTFVFDKTGTLTKGNFRVQSCTDEETLILAAALESRSTHPIAKSIVRAAEGLLVPSPETVKEISGRGLEGIVSGAPVLAGNRNFLEERGISVPEDSEAGTLVHLAKDGAYRGRILIADEIKPGLEALAADLKKAGAREVVMLTGDRREIAEFVGDSLGIDRVQSDLLPQDKLEAVETLIAEGRRVLFAGDGINDAPVLARADLGAAMGGLGSDAAIEAADIVLMTDDPTKLLTAKKIARKTRKIVLENIVFALGIKGLFLLLGAFGYATMYEAIFADVGVALLAVLNALRVLRD